MKNKPIKKHLKVALVSGGRESAAMVIELEKRFGTKEKPFCDVKIFADTGDDPEGRKVVDKLNKLGWNIVIVQSKYGNIFDYYNNIHVADEKNPELSGHAMPYRAQKDCSSKFKISPVRGYLKHNYPIKEGYHYIMYYGFTNSKKDVKRKYKILDPKYKVSFCSFKFPLIDIFKFDRTHCTELCEKTFGFVPKRSLCDMCFEKTQKDWKLFYKENPEKTMKIIDFEESSHIFKVYGYGLNAYPIRRILKLEAMKDTKQVKLFTDEEIAQTSKDEEWLKQNSPTCACMNENLIFMPTEEEDELNYRELNVPKIKVVKHN